MRYRIENEFLSCDIDLHGAEVKSLIRKSDGREMMWEANPAYWGRTSPVLFPFVGGVKDKRYRYEGKTYTIGQHGFARDMDLTLESEKEDEIWFRLSETEETLRLYPFRFVLRIGYRLEEKILRVMWEVSNPDDKEMYFSIGAHPAFAISSLEGHMLKLYDPEGRPLEQFKNRIFGAGGCVTNRVETVETPDGCLLLTEELFDGDALVIEDRQVGWVVLLDATDLSKSPLVSVSFDAPLVGIWSPPHKNAPFVCIEPWYGRCDAEDYDGELQNREYEQRLEGRETFRAGYMITVTDIFK